MAKRPLFKTRHTDLMIPYAKGRRNRGRAINKAASLQNFLQQFCEPLRSPETFKQYMALPKAEQDELKSLNNWWLGGHTIDGHRRASSITERTVLTFDADTLPPPLFNDLSSGDVDFPFAYALHTTRKHEPDKPRARIMVPLSSPVSSEAYVAVTRILAAKFDPTLEAFDPVSFRHSQLMYFPTVCKDGEFICNYIDAPLANAQEVLDEWSAENGPWTDFENLPFAESWGKERKRAQKAEDPTTKDGLVGAFCRAYGIEAVIAEFLSDKYIDRVENGREVRYTYAGGTTANGAVNYDDLFLYSFHAHDPCNQRLVNAFDLVRIHLYGDLDDKVEDPETAKVTSLPSYKAMMARFAKDDAVLREYNDDADESATATAFEDLSDTPGDGNVTDEPPSQLTLMNKRHAVALNHGRAVILTIEGKEIDYSSITDLRIIYSHMPMPNGKGGETDLGDWWIKHPKRRTYWGGIEFAPGQELNPRIFNLWCGWALEPDGSKSCELYLNHLWNNICQYDKTSYDYLIGWLAHMLQKPQEKPGVAVVLRGLKGVGKDVVGDYLEGLFPQNYVKTAQPEQLTGKFNSHHEKAILVHVEEGHWAGDKKAEGVLKHIITAPITLIERKGIDAIPMRSYSRVLITSNERWAVPATIDDRRWAIYEVGAEHKQDTRYFDAIMNEARNGGHAALLHFLLNYDLSGCDVRNPPNTEGLSLQKQAGLKNASAYWKSLLSDGELPAGALSVHFHDGDGWMKNPARARVNELYEDYMTWWQRHHRFGQGDLLEKHTFGMELSKMCPSREPTRAPRPSRETLHKFPPLAVCRAEFEKFLGSFVEWPKPLDDDLIG